MKIPAEDVELLRRAATMSGQANSPRAAIARSTLTILGIPVVPGRPMDAPPALEVRVGALEATVAGLGAPAGFNTLEARVARLEEALGALDGEEEPE